MAKAVLDTRVVSLIILRIGLATPDPKPGNMDVAVNVMVRLVTIKIDLIIMATINLIAWPFRLKTHRS